MKPVYIINGFLDSGKTEFIQFTMEQPYFEVDGITLLILCEEGENEYSQMLLDRTRTVLEIVDEEEEFTPNYMLELEKKYNPERIIIEYNGMWNFKSLKLPCHWKIEQQVTNIDASTFLLYFNNMKSLLIDMFRQSELIIFNRCDGIEELTSYKRNIKAVNQKAEIIFEDSKGEMGQMMEADLPYDLEEPIIVLNNDSYTIWYLDSLEHLNRYIGKTVEFVGMVLKPESFPAEYFVPGRTTMTCCADDMAFLGFVCHYKNADLLQTKEWVRVTAVVQQEYFADYEGEGPVLHAITIEKTKAPKEEIIRFV